MKTERELYQEHYKTSRDYKFYVKHEITEKQIFDFKRGRYSVGCVNDGWAIWQASASREGYKLVPVETLEEALSWANCASSESWSDEQREEIDKHYGVIEKAMIGVGE